MQKLECCGGGGIHSSGGIILRRGNKILWSNMPRGAIYSGGYLLRDKLACIFSRPSFSMCVCVCVHVVPTVG